MTDTIFALSSGAPPAALAVIRISGPAAGAAITSIAGVLPTERRASLRKLRSADGDLLDQALVLWFPGPATATGEDLAELHLHGGRAVVRSVEIALEQCEGLRPAAPGEFTRRAFANGRIDLAEAEGLADLLSAETDLQRKQALILASGTFSAKVAEWKERLLMASASVEAILDFGDEDDVSELPDVFRSDLRALADELGIALDAPRAEVLRDGFRVVLAGPPNAGKSSLFNLLVEQDAAITAPIAGTTRDVLTRPVSLGGVPFVFADTAGLRESSDDVIEKIGMERARGALDDADLVLWLGPEGDGLGRIIWEIESFADLGHTAKREPRHRVSGVSGDGIAALRDDLIATASRAMPSANSAALNKRQHSLIAEAQEAIEESGLASDPLLIAEALRVARVAFERLVGQAATEDMLDTLFGRFCIGK